MQNTSSQKVLLVIFVLQLLFPTVSKAEDGGKTSTQTTKPSTTKEVRLSPSPRQSQEPEVSPSPKLKALTSLCQVVDKQISSVGGKLTTDQNAEKSVLDKAITQRAGQEAQASKILATRRTEWSAVQSQYFAKLADSAKTADQKNALATFEAAVKQAISIKQTANDAATTAYHASVQAADLTRKTAATQALGVRNAAIVSAVQAAKVSCAETTSNPDTIRQTYISTDKQVRDAYKSTLDAANSAYKTTISTAVAAHKDADQKALAIYTNSINAARAALKLAWGTTNQ